MDIEAFVLCDAATDDAGKLNVLGAFDSLLVAGIPVVHPQCAIALRMRFQRMEEGEHRLKVGIVDEDGHSVVPDLEAKLNIGFRGPESSLAANMIMNLQRLQLKKAGEYSVNLAVDGRHERSIPLVVRMRAPKPN